MADATMLQARQPFARMSLAPAAISGAGVRAQPLPHLGLATVLQRKGQQAALIARLQALYGIDPPEGPRRTAAGPLAFVGTGPGAWLAVREHADAGWPARLAQELDGLASVMDQSDGYAALRLDGPAVVEVLAKGVFLDLSPKAFPVGAAAGVSIAHIGVLLWRQNDLVFDLLTFRSFATSFWRWLEESAAEFGLAVLPPDEPQAG